MKKILMVGEDASTFLPGLDTGVLLAHEMKARGLEVHYLEGRLYPWKGTAEDYFSKLPVREITQVYVDKSPAFTLGPYEKGWQGYDLIWQRLDPPVDEAYVGVMKQFMTLPASLPQINSPHWNWKLSEHLLPQQYPAFAVPTYHIESWESFLDHVRHADSEVVAKPVNLFSGHGISFFKKDTPEPELLAYWQKWQPALVLQPFLKEVSESGDLRILTMNGKVMGTVIRRPKAGSRLANLHQGGTAHRWDPSPKQLKASAEISADLGKKGLHLLGLDFIGDYLTEVNITCPSAVPQINEVMGIHAEALMVDEMLVL